MMASVVGKPENLATTGPLVAVKLWVPRQLKSDQQPIDTLAEIDTAIATTCIQEGVATSLGLEPVGTKTITTALKLKYEAHLFRIRVVFPEQKMMFEVDAVEVPYMLRPHARIKCLIGRDILQHSILTYNGPNNTFSLAFSHV
jgi:predicted aspartyl protease